MGNPRDRVQKAEEFVNKVLDIHAPIRKVIVRKHYKPGLSQKVKTMIKERESCRREAARKAGPERLQLHAKYKKLRNKVTKTIRKDDIRAAAEKIANANGSNELWKIANEITKPRSDATLTLKEEEKEIEGELENGKVINNFFLDKLEALGSKRKQKYMADVLEKLRRILRGHGLKFSFKKVTVAEVMKVLKKLKNKGSSGIDGLSSKIMKAASSVLAIPLTDIVNCSLETGIFPQPWKFAKVVPLLKKGDPQAKENYRPVALLPVASKVLEAVVRSQLTSYFEDNNLLPNSQHGFRGQRSTVTALAAIQHEWTATRDKGHTLPE